MNTGNKCVSMILGCYYCC